MVYLNCRIAGVYAGVHCELNSADAGLISRKYRIFYVQRGFLNFDCEYLFTPTFRKKKYK